jgi:hypothetical protein
MLEADGNTPTLQPNTVQLDELLEADADDELFVASDYLPVSFQINNVMIIFYISMFIIV